MGEGDSLPAIDTMPVEKTLSEDLISKIFDPLLKYKTLLELVESRIIITIFFFFFFFFFFFLVSVRSHLTPLPFSASDVGSPAHLLWDVVYLCKQAESQDIFQRVYSFLKGKLEADKWFLSSLFFSCPTL